MTGFTDRASLRRVSSGSGLVALVLSALLATHALPASATPVPTADSSQSACAASGAQPRTIPSHQTIFATVNQAIATPALQTCGLGSTVTYSLSARPPAGMKFDAKTGSLSGAPTSATGHTYVVTA
ncbi:MAG: putative Ig domain-containing protein [Actinomycetota bacterium]